MAIDFNEIVAKAKAEITTRATANEQMRREEAAERSRIVDAGINFLEANVLPLLEKAKAAFTQQTGADAKIDKKYDVNRQYGSEWPSLSFKCIVHVRKSDGYIFESLPVFFSSDGSKTNVGKGKFSFTDKPDESIGIASGQELQALIEKAVETAFASYFDEAQHHRHGV
jgi:hypothetical protein